MALELDKLALAGIGLIAKMQDMVQDFVEGKTTDEEAPVVEEETTKNINDRFETLVELGEERYNEWLDKGKGERDKLSETIKDRASKVFSELGLVTKEDVEELEDKISRLQRQIKKAQTAKKA